MMYSPRFRLLPTTVQREAMDWTRNTVRQVYNHGLREFNNIPETQARSVNASGASATRSLR
jgi:Helix-turn-helix domain.